MLDFSDGETPRLRAIRTVLGPIFSA